ncbi:MAG TPA: hypothetical protein VI215_10865 [Bacteroidota bacterium]|jgi:hypothetical protein
MRIQNRLTAFISTLMVARFPAQQLLLSSLLICSTSALYAQKAGGTAEDSLNANWRFEPSTDIGGYGNALYQHNSASQTATADLERVVLFVGHRFSPDISFFSELEVEDAKVTGGEEGGEVAFEQAYVKFSLDPMNYFKAGLFLPPLGILNEDHLPTSFNGNERTQVETYIIPSTWREIGVGFYGSINGTPLTYSAGLVTGLSGAAFENGSGIREGRFEGRLATANNGALTGSLQWNRGDLRAKVSGYYGGTVGVNSDSASALQLNSGFFGTPVGLGEADLQYSVNGFTFRALGTFVSIPDAFALNRAYGNNTAESEYGAYLEVGYDLLSSRMKGAQLIGFVRYEKLDMNSKVPSNAVIDERLNQQHVIVGLNYLPVNSVALKADIRFFHTAASSESGTTFVNAGIGWSF